MEIDIYDLSPFAFINGQRGLHDTEANFYKYLVSRNETPIVIDSVFSIPSKIKALKFLKPKTIVLGTTGCYADKLDMALAEFIKIKTLPQFAIFTMGEDYFNDFLKSGVVGYKLYPMYFDDNSPIIEKI